MIAEQADISKQKSRNIQQRIDIGKVYSKQRKGMCSYCQNKAQTEYRFEADKMTPETCQKLSEKGWARYQFDYFKPYLETTCCKQWTRRMDVTEFCITKAQIKTMRKAIRYFMGVKKEEKEQKEEKEEKEQKEEEKEQKKSKQKYKKIIQEQSKQISESDLKSLQQIEAIIENIFFQNIQKISQILQQKAHIMKIPIIEEIQLIDLRTKTKYFICQNPKQGAYYSNQIMLLFGLFKKYLPQGSKFGVSNFGQAISDIIVFQNEDYNVAVGKGGYLTYKKNFQKPNGVNSQNKDSPQKNKMISLEGKKQGKQKAQKMYSKNMTQQDLDFKVTQNSVRCGQLMIKIQKACFTEQKFELWDKYRAQIHGKPNNNVQSFKSFICQQGLIYEQLQNSQPCNEEYSPSFRPQLKEKISGKATKRMGCYHMNYYVGDRLIGVNSLNILPCSLQSRYFFYSPQFAWLRLGVFSAIVDIEFMRWMGRSFPQFKYYNMCYFIQNCQKMSYKSQYGPSELLCPVTYKWVKYTPEVKEKIAKIDNKQTNCLRLAGPQQQIDEDMDFPQELDIFMVENIQLRVEDQSTFETYYQAVMGSLQDMCRNVGKELSKHFIWELKIPAI